MVVALSVKLPGKSYLHLVAGLNHPNQRHGYRVYTVLNDIAWSNWEWYRQGMVLDPEIGLQSLVCKFWIVSTESTNVRLSRPNCVLQVHVYHLENSEHGEFFDCGLRYGIKYSCPKIITDDGTYLFCTVIFARPTDRTVCVQPLHLS